MSRRQTRRTISLKAENYERFRRAAEAAGMSLCAFIESAGEERCRLLGIEPVPRAEALQIQSHNREAHNAKRDRRRVEAADVSKHFPGPYG